MNVVRKILRTGTDNKLPSNHKKAQQGHEFGFYISEQKKAPFIKEDWTCENEFYRFPIDESPKDPWERCFEVVDKADEELYKDLKDEISGLLVVASLFLGIVTAFSSMSFGWLRVDDRKVSAALLGDIVKLLNDTDARGTVPPRDATDLNFHPRDSEIIVNQLWFLSMTLSLSAVVAGTLCLQWLSTFRRKEAKQRPHIDALALRQLRFEGIMGWGIPQVPGFLLLTVQCALILFAIGLIYLLWSINKRVAIPVILVGGAAALLLIITTIMPLLQSVIGWIFPSTLIIPQCPYKSPISWVLHRSCVLLSIIVTLPFALLPSFQEVSKWRSKQVELLTDYTWQVFDVFWRDQRECWGPQTSKSGSRKYSYYLVHGLGSAMEILVFQPNAVHIIQTCLRDFYETTAEAETFEDLFGKNTDVVKQALSEYKAIVKMVDDEKSISHKNLLKRDFLNAHALQHFVAHNPNLHRALLSHRVELYIRIKNSSRHFGSLVRGGPGGNDSISAKKQYIGTSIHCPIQSTRDAEALSFELRHQFLKFGDWFLETDRCSESDKHGFKCFFEAKNMHIVPDARAGEPPIRDRAEGVHRETDEHLTESSSHRRRSTSATNDSGTVFDSGGEHDSWLDHEQASQGDRGPDGFKDPGDKMESSPTIPSTADWKDLYQRVLGKFETEHEPMKRPKMGSMVLRSGYHILPY